MTDETIVFDHTEGEVRRETPALPTVEEIQALLPHAAIETSCDGELVIWTGWAANPKDPAGPVIDWCEECESTGTLEKDETCPQCGRTGGGDPPMTDQGAEARKGGGS